MTTLAQAVQAVQTAFATAWGTSVPYAADGEAFAPPADGSAWARMTIRHVPDQQTSLGRTGARIFTHRAIVLVEIYSPGNVAGRAALDTLARTARGAFHGKTLGGAVFCEAASIQEQRAFGRWLQTNVTCPFSYRETE